MRLNGFKSSATLLYCLLLSFPIFANTDYEKALQSFQKKEFQASYIHLKNVLAQHPEHIAGKVLMGKILLQKGHFDEAITEFEEALIQGADIELMLSELANSYLFMGKNEEVINLGKRFNLSTQSLFTWHLLCAAAHLNLNDTVKARESFAKATAINPNSTSLLNSQAALLLKENRLNEAESLINKALDLNALNPQALQLKGELLQLQGHYVKAQDFFEKAVEQNPEDPILRRSQLRNYVSQLKTEQAEVVLNYILEKTPNDAYALLLSTWLSSLKQNDTTSSQSSRQLSEQLWQLTKEQILADPSLIFTRALLSYVDGSYEKARNDLVHYNQTVPSDLNAVAILSDVYIRQGDNSLAISLLEKHLDQLNTMPELAKRLVTLYIRTNRAFKAEQLITELRLQHPENIEFILLQASVLKQLSKFEEANKLVNEQAKQHENNRLLQINQALFALDEKNYTKAINIIDSLLEAEPKNLHYLNFKAAALIKNSQHQHALNILQQIVKIQPEHDAALFNIANIAMTNHDYNQAITLLTSLVKRHPDHKATNTLLGVAYFRNNQFEQAEHILQKTIATRSYLPADEALFDVYFHQQKYDKALSLTEQGLKRAFMDEKLLWKKAQLHLLLKHTNESIKVQNVLESIVNNDADKLLKLALMQRESNQLDASLRTLQNALKLAPKNTIIMLELSNHYLLSNELRLLETQLEELKKITTNNANVIMLQGDLALAKNQTDLAHQHFVKALTLDNNFKLIWVKLYQLAKAGIQTQDFADRALQTLQKRPNDAWLRRLLAEHYVNSKKSADAIAQYEYLLTNKHYLDDAFLYNNLANLYILTDINKAQSYAKKSVDLAPKQAFSLNTYGWVLALAGQYDKALPILRQANAINAVDPSIQYHIAYTLVKLYRSEEAKPMLNTLKNTNVEFSEKDDAIVLLNELLK